jgi:hypothetical protein
VFFKLGRLHHDITWHESEVRRLLPVGASLDESVQQACGHFERILGSVFASLQEPRRYRFWCPDDLWCESLGFEGSVAALVGSACWLEGGQECDRFRIDVALDLDPLLYSYKFSHAETGRQSLYVAKTPGGWHFAT